MYAVSHLGTATGLSPTYHRIRSFPKVAGSPLFAPPLGNVARQPPPDPSADEPASEGSPAAE